MFCKLKNVVSEFDISIYGDYIFTRWIFEFSLSCDLFFLSSIMAVSKFRDEIEKSKNVAL